MLFFGSDIEIPGGFAEGSGGTIPPLKYGFAVPTLTNCVPAIPENKNAEMKTAVNSLFFSTCNPYFMVGGFCCKSVFVNIS